MPVIIFMSTHISRLAQVGLDSDSIGWFQYAAENYRI